MPWKSALWNALDKPLDWWVLPAWIGASFLMNILELGWQPAAIRGGVVLALGIPALLLGLRRLIVGHWR
jgi:hypothetical protein